MSDEDRLRTPPEYVPGVPRAWIEPGKAALDELVGLLHALSELANEALLALREERSRGRK